MTKTILLKTTFIDLGDTTLLCISRSTLYKTSTDSSVESKKFIITHTSIDYLILLSTAPIRSQMITIILVPKYVRQRHYSP